MASISLRQSVISSAVRSVVAVVAGAGALMSGQSADAAIILKANNTIALNDVNSWGGATPPAANVPGSLDIAQWNNVVTGANATVLGADTTWQGIKIVNPGGAVTINAGNTLTLGTDGIDLSTATQNLTIAAPVVLGSSQTWKIGAGRTLTVNGGISGGSNGITLQGSGSFAIGTTVANTFTGPLAINGVNFTFTNSATVLNNNFSTSMPLSLASGFIRQNNINNAGGHSQTFAGTTVDLGASQVQNVRTSGGIPQLFMGTVSRPNVGGTVNFNMSSASGAAGIKATGSGMIGGWAFWGQNRGINDPLDFANANGASLMSAVSHTGGTNIFGAGINTDITAASVNVLSGVNTQSVRFGTAVASTVTLAGATQITSGGILVNSTVAANNNLITGGSLSGATGKDLIVYQNSSTAAGGSGTLRIDSTITDATTATALTKAGTGTLILGGNNSYTGGVYINSGDIRLANPGALNSTTPNAVTFTNGNTTTVLTQSLTLNGNTSTINGLSTTAVVGTGTATPVVQNANVTPAILTINSSANTTYAGNLQNGTGGGSFGLTKSGTGTQTLSGSNTYTGATTINNGTLLVSSSINSSSAINVVSPGFLDVTTNGLTVGSGNSVSGTGTVLGSVTAGSGANVTPGGLAVIGNLTMTNLSLGGSSVLNLDLDATSGVSDLLTVGSALNLTAGINVNLAGAGAGLTGNSYTIFNYGSVGGFSPANFSIASGGFGGLTYTFADTGSGAITLTIGGALAANSTWALTTGGSWNAPASNWTPATVPTNAGDTANFNNSILAASTVELDGSKTVGVLNFNSPQVYTIATGTGGNLILDNGVGVANVVDNSVPANPLLPGQVIAANVTLNSNSSFSVTSGETLAVTGAIGGVGGLTKAGLGTLNLASVNNYAGPTSLNAGKLHVVNGAVSNTAFTFGGGTLQYATGNNEDLSAGRTVTFAGQAIIDTNGNDVTFIAPVGNSGAGGLTKQGLGKLSLAAGNTHTGANVIDSGTLNIAADSSLGAIPGVAATNLTINNGGSLQFANATTLNANRSVLLSGGTAVIDTNGNNATIAGATSGGGALNKIGVGTLSLSGPSTGSGAVIVDAGTVAVTTQANLPSGQLILNNTAGVTASASSTFSPQVNGTNSIAQTGSVITNLNVLTGNGMLTFGGTFVNDYTGNFSGFTGTLVANAGGSRWNGSTGGINVKLDLTNTGTAVRSGATGITLGAIAGLSTANISGGTGGQTQAIVYTIGGKTVGGLGVTPVDSVYDGTITNGGSTSVGLTKVGNSTLTLTNLNNTYTGATLVQAGALIVDGSLTASATTVSGTGQLKGIGSVQGVTVQPTGTIAPGGSIGTLTTAGLTLDGTYAAEINTTDINSDKLIVTAFNLNAATTSLLTLTDLGADVALLFNTKLTLVEYTTWNGNVFSGYADGFQFPLGSNTFEIDYNDPAVNSGNALTLTAVPEPTTLGLIGLAAVGLLRRRRAC